MNFKQLAVSTALLLISLTSFAATKPLNSPQGLALDAKGNLYVANNLGNQILIYSPGYAQMTAKTISTGVRSPSAVTIDVLGNIWVANLGSGPSGTGSVTEYSSAGVQNPNGTITDGVDYPYAIATDGIADIWVENNFNNATVYPIYGAIPPAPIKTVPFTYPITGLAAHNMWMAFGGNNFTTLEEISTVLSPVIGVAYGTVGSSAYALAYDTAGNLYCGTIQDALTVTTPAGATKQLIALGYFPFGVAVDSVRARIYVSDGNHNQINVYSTTTGALLHTIQ